MPEIYEDERTKAKDRRRHRQDVRWFQDVLLHGLKDKDWRSKPVFDDKNDEVPKDMIYDCDTSGQYEETKRSADDWDWRNYST
jgi:hypothetical protein